MMAAAQASEGNLGRDTCNPPKSVTKKRRAAAVLEMLTPSRMDDDAWCPPYPWLVATVPPFLAPAGGTLCIVAVNGLWRNVVLPHLSSAPRRRAKRE